MKKITTIEQPKKWKNTSQEKKEEWKVITVKSILSCLKQVSKKWGKILTTLRDLYANLVDEENSPKWKARVEQERKEINDVINKFNNFVKPFKEKESLEYNEFLSIFQKFEEIYQQIEETALYIKRPDPEKKELTKNLFEYAKKLDNEKIMPLLKRHKEKRLGIRYLYALFPEENITRYDYNSQYEKTIVYLKEKNKDKERIFFVENNQIQKTIKDQKWNEYKVKTLSTRSRKKITIIIQDPNNPNKEKTEKCELFIDEETNKRYIKR